MGIYLHFKEEIRNYSFDSSLTDTNKYLVK